MPRVEVILFDRGEMQCTLDFAGPVEMGRQKRASESLYGAYPLPDGRSRLVVASTCEDNVSRQHALIEPLEDQCVRVTNLSTVLPIYFETPPGPPLLPGEQREVGLPQLIRLGSVHLLRLQPPSKPDAICALAGDGLPDRPPDDPTASTSRLPRPEVRCHTDVSFPAQVTVNQHAELRVRLVPAELVSPSGQVVELPRPHAHDVTFQVQTSCPVEVVLALAHNFEVESPHVQKVAVPPEGPSDAVTFLLRGIDVGPGRLTVDFFQAGQPAGSVSLFPRVVASEVSGAEQAPRSELGVLLSANPTRAPDVVLRILVLELGSHDRLVFLVNSQRADLADLDVCFHKAGEVDLKANLESWVAQQLHRLSDLAAGPSPVEADRVLADIGNRLYDDVLPEYVKELCWELRHRQIRTLQIISDEPHIPWELLRPVRRNRLTRRIEQEDVAWGQAFELAHWLEGRPAPTRLSMARVCALAVGGGKPGDREVTRNLVPVGQAGSQDAGSDRTGQNLSGASLPADPALPSADEELRLLWLLAERGSEVEVVRATRNELLRLLEKGGFTVLHLACHGAFDRSLADASALLLEDGVFHSNDIPRRLEERIRASAPLIFLNACESGRTGFSLTRLGSWGHELVRLGCGGFVGTLWEVSDRAAVAFAGAFYRAFSAGVPIAAAVHQAREQIRCEFPGDPTWLAYRCFAHPLAHVQRQPAPLA
jgi:hypothetical protein